MKTLSFDRTAITATDPEWDLARRAWNLTVDQRPALIAVPESAQDVAAAVRYAAGRGLRVAAQGTGHGAPPLGDLAGTMLIKTHKMRGLVIDPVARTARAEAGVLWREVTDAAAAHGLAGLAGSSPDVGVAGYTLGGGMGWLGRTYGLSANNVQAIEAVLASGERVRADACHEPDLFWALRGGGGSFAVVTAIELRLYPITEVHAGLLWWPATRAEPVLHAWRELTDSGLPDEFTTAFRVLHLPEAGPVVVVDVIHLGPAAEADALLAPLRALGPGTDTIGPMPTRALQHLHMDPAEPAPSLGDGLMLDRLPAHAVDTLIPYAVPPLLVVELRHAGGEMRRARPGNGALAAVDAEYVLFAGGLAVTPALAGDIAAHVRAVKQAMAPWAARQTYLNITETRTDPARFWDPHAYARLRRVKAAVDPADRIRSNHPIPL
jgi:FAD/FMN-containing dehydrogenase